MNKKGKTFISRGGNGKLTKQQIALAGATGLPMEFSIGIPGHISGQFECLPRNYKVDLACPSAKVAIEVDGDSHKSKRWKFLDRRKEAILSALGWSVLRFWNMEVDQNLQAVADKINSFIASKSLTTTIFSLTES
jgi:Protein of unknown function (DUF559)